MTSLAFDDDLVLVGGSWSDMAHNLWLLESFCRSTGLRVQHRKCGGFLVRPSRGSFTVNDCPPWVLEGRALPLTNINDTITYLGVKINPWVGVDKPDLIGALNEWLRKIDRFPLKPSQRVKLLNQCAIPRLFYQADHCGVGDGVLKVLDGMIRSTVKRWLHLPPSTCDGLLYSRHWDGGLGIWKLAQHIPFVRARRAFALSHSTDRVVCSLMSSSRAAAEFGRLWRRADGMEFNLPPMAVRFQTSRRALPPAY